MVEMACSNSVQFANPCTASCWLLMAGRRTFDPQSGRTIFTNKTLLLTEFGTTPNP